MCTGRSAVLGHGRCQALIPSPTQTCIASFIRTSNNHGEVVADEFPAFMCPSDVLPKEDNNGFGKSNYCVCVGDDSPWQAQATRVLGQSESRPCRRACSALPRAMIGPKLWAWVRSRTE